MKNKGNEFQGLELLALYPSELGEEIYLIVKEAKHH